MHSFGDQEMTARFKAFTGSNVRCLFETVIAEAVDQRLQDMASDTDGAAAGDQFAEFPTIDIPRCLKFATRFTGHPGEQISAVEFPLQIGADKRLRKGRAAKMSALKEIKCHGVPPA